MELTCQTELCLSCWKNALCFHLASLLSLSILVRFLLCSHAIPIWKKKSMFSGALANLLVHPREFSRRENSDSREIAFSVKIISETCLEKAKETEKRREREKSLETFCVPPTFISALCPLSNKQTNAAKTLFYSKKKEKLSFRTLKTTLSKGNSHVSTWFLFPFFFLSLLHRSIRNSFHQTERKGGEKAVEKIQVEKKKKAGSCSWRDSHAKV